MSLKTVKRIMNQDTEHCNKALNMICMNIIELQPKWHAEINVVIVGSFCFGGCDRSKKGFI